VGISLPRRRAEKWRFVAKTVWSHPNLTVRGKNRAFVLFRDYFRDFESICAVSRVFVLFCAFFDVPRPFLMFCSF